ncbi:MAG: ABC transporter ATP-binding protein [Nitrososphaerota archaeon]
MEEVLRLEGIEKRFSGKKILQDISIQVRERSFTGILGPIGAGKTTLLKIIAGTVKPDKGRVYLRGMDITELPPQKRRVAMVFQGFSLYPNLTVFENIASPLRAEGRSGQEIRIKVEEQAEYLRIGSLLNKYPYELSGGESQRVAIARALVKEADVYLFDEPLTNLDFKLREGLAVELKNILKREGFNGTILYATPNFEEVLAMSTDTILMRNGKIVWNGPTLSSYLVPPCIDFAKYFPSPPMNFFECHLIKEEDKHYLFATEELKLDVTCLKDLLQEGEYVLGIYPHHFSIQQTGDSIFMTFHLILAEITPSGTFLHLEYKEEKVTAFLPHPQDFKGRVVRLFIDPRNIFVFSKRTGELILRYGGTDSGKDRT